MEQLYDVTLFGVQEGKDRKEVARAIAASFSLAPEKAELLMQKQSATLIKKAVPLETAERYHAVLARAGAKSNFKPTVSGADRLELVPKAKPTFVCPECGSSHELEDEESRPTVCAKCGLVFDKHSGAQHRKQEEEAIRRRLQRIKDIRDEEERKKKQQEEEDRRRKELEEQIRHELGLPAVVNSRSRLWSSAAATLVLGIGIGALGAKFFSSEQSGIEAPASLAMEQSADAVESVISGPSGAGGTGQDFPEGSEQEVREQLQALSQEVERVAMAEQVGNGQGPVAGASAALTSADESSGSPSITSAVPPDEMALETLRGMSDEDPEWDSYIQEIVQARLEADALSSARRLAESVHAPLTRYLTQASVAVGYTRTNQPDDADALLRNIIENLESSSSGAHRVELFTAIAPVLAEAEMQPAAAHLMSKAADWTRGIEPAGERADSWAHIGKAQARLGLPKEASDSIRNATATLEESMPAEQRVRATARLAEVFSRLGAQDAAQRILEKGQVAAERIDQPAEHDLAIQSLARSWVRTGNLERGLDMSEQLSTSAERDGFLLALLQDQAFSGEHFGLPSVADAIAAPRKRARAYAFLGRTSSSPRIAKGHFQHAISVSDEIKETVDKTLVQGEIARFLTRSDDKQDGVLLFEQAEVELNEFSPGPERDIGWARLAQNRARALELAKAEGYLDMVGSTQVIEVAQKDLARVSRTISAM